MTDHLDMIDRAFAIVRELNGISHALRRTHTLDLRQFDETQVVDPCPTYRYDLRVSADVRPSPQGDVKS